MMRPSHEAPQRGFESSAFAESMPSSECSTPVAQPPLAPTCAPFTSSPLSRHADAALLTAYFVTHSMRAMAPTRTPSTPVDRELMRGAGPTAVLKLLERGEMYGYELVEAIDKRTDGILAMGQSTLYPLLYNMEAKGLLASRWSEENARPRKYYRLTAAGRKRLAADSLQWRAVAQAMGSLGVVYALS